jgi:hypothetical protein
MLRGASGFLGHWTPDKIRAQRDAWEPGQIPLRDGYLPMIPLVKSLREHPPRPMTKESWPRLAAMPAKLSKAVERRLQAVYDMLMAEYRPASRCKRLAISLGPAIP